jgi:hypothetical protein
LKIVFGLTASVVDRGFLAPLITDTELIILTGIRKTMETLHGLAVIVGRTDMKLNIGRVAL